MHRLLELVLIPASHPHLTSLHPWAPGWLTGATWGETTPPYK